MGSEPTAAPEGLRYVPDFITAEEEQELLREIEMLPWGDVRMHGVVAKRRVVHFGWIYGYESWRIEPGPPIPDFLLPLRARAATLIGQSAERLEEVLITQYPPGSGIGWHRDAPMFGPLVVGISLLSPCRLRFQRRTKEDRQSFVLPLEPRSAYVLSGSARGQWQHAITATPSLRYSVTFRTLRTGRTEAAVPFRSV